MRDFFYSFFRYVQEIRELIVGIAFVILLLSGAIALTAMGYAAYEAAIAIKKEGIVYAFNNRS